MHIVNVWKVWDGKEIKRPGIWWRCPPLDSFAFEVFPSLIYKNENGLKYAAVGGLDIAIIDGKKCWRRNTI